MEKIQDSFPNYGICCYCSYIVYSTDQNRYQMGCGRVKNKQGQYARITIMGDEIDAIKRKGGNVFNVLQGCNRFQPNGLPAHPIARKEMIEFNPKAEKIPEDPQATETSDEFERKARVYAKEIIFMFNARGEFTIQ